jgi:hypothetical protein
VLVLAAFQLLCNQCKTRGIHATAWDAARGWCCSVPTCHRCEGGLFAAEEEYLALSLIYRLRLRKAGVAAS